MPASFVITPTATCSSFDPLSSIFGINFDVIVRKVAGQYFLTLLTPAQLHRNDNFLAIQDAVPGFLGIFNVASAVLNNADVVQKNSNLVGQKLLLFHPIDLNDNYIGKSDVVAIDVANAGIGDTVLLVQEGKAVQQILGHKNAPVHSIVIAVVDSI